MHPNCRCTTVGWDEENELEGEAYKQLEGQKQLDYEEWKRLYVDDRVEIELPKQPESPAPVIPAAQNAAVQTLTNTLNSGKITSREQQFFSDLQAGKINIQLDTRNQEKHTVSDNWKNNAVQQHLKIISGDTKTGNPKSCLFMEMNPETLIAKYSGTGRLVFDDLHGTVNEFIETGYPVGITYERELKKFVRSTTLQIKYTKTGVHIFPTKRWNRGD